MRLLAALGLVGGIAVVALTGSAASARSIGSVGSVRSTTSVLRPPVRDSSGATAGTHGWFQPGTSWWGDFGDPTVVRVGSTYYAYATPSAGRYLPILTSTDLVTWKVHDRWTTKGPPGSPGYSVTNDTSIPAEIRGQANMGAGVFSASDWARYDTNDGQVRVSSGGTLEPQGPWIKRTIWAPGVTKIGDTWFAYSA